MFRTILLGAYIIPGAYVFFRLRSYISDNHIRKFFSIFFITVAATFPCVELLSHSSNMPWVTSITKIAYYSLPYLLYVFLAVLLIDIVLWLNRLVRIVPGVIIDLPIILLDHRPSDFSRVSSANVDIQISGHTHNGQLFPLNYITSNIYDLSWGHKIINNTHFFVTSGLQGWGPSVRTAGTAEIMVINIDFI